MLNCKPSNLGGPGLGICQQPSDKPWCLMLQMLDPFSIKPVWPVESGKLRFRISTMGQIQYIFTGNGHVTFTT